MINSTNESRSKKKKPDKMNVKTPSTMPVRPHESKVLTPLSRVGEKKNAESHKSIKTPSQCRGNAGRNRKKRK